MAKTTVPNIITSIKRLVDYNISDPDGIDLTILEGINIAQAKIKQWFMDADMYDEIGAHDTLSTVADQEYVDIATETVDMDQPYSLSERTNDNPIDIITFKEYRERFPDPSADKSNTPDVAAFFANRVYFGPTPSGVITIYFDYIKLITKLTSTTSGSLSFEDKYDELVIKICIEELTKWFDRGNRQAVLTAKEDVITARHDLITGASKNFGQSNQMQSRRGERPYFAPKKVIT